MSLNLPQRRKTMTIDVSMAIVNIVLLLIFFFVVSGQRVLENQQIDLSETQSLPLEALPSPILVIDREGNWSLDGAAITPALLPVALQQTGDSKVLYLIIDRAAKAGQLIAALNQPELQNMEIQLVTLHQGVFQ